MCISIYLSICLVASDDVVQIRRPYLGLVGAVRTCHVMPVKLPSLASMDIYRKKRMLDGMAGG